MTRIKAILAAGTLTGVVLATAVGLGVRNIVNADEPTVEPTEVTEPEPDPEAVIEAQRQQLEIMRAREEQYRAEIEAANQSILDLQTQLAQPVYVQGAPQDSGAAPASVQSAPAPSGGGEEHEDDERDDHEEDDDHEEREDHEDDD